MQHLSRADAGPSNSGHRTSWGVLGFVGCFMVSLASPHLKPIASPTCDTKNVSRHCQMSAAGQNHPSEGHCTGVRHEPPSKRLNVVPTPEYLEKLLFALPQHLSHMPWPCFLRRADKKASGAVGWAWLCQFFLPQSLFLTKWGWF